MDKYAEVGGELVGAESIVEYMNHLIIKNIHSVRKREIQV